MGIFLLRTIAIFIAIAAILVIKDQFPGTEARLGRLSAGVVALGAAGAGAFLGALTAPVLGQKLPKPHLVLLGFTVSAAGLLLLGGIATLPATVGLTFLGGYGAFVAKIAVDAEVQEDLPDEFRGRAFSLYDILYNAASVVAAIVMVVFAQFALRPLLVLAGVATAVMAAFLTLRMRRAGMLQPTS